MLFAIFLKNQNLSSRQLNFQNVGPVLLSQILFRRWNCFLLSVTRDSKDGHGLKLQKVVPTFSSFNVMPAKIIKKILVSFPWWNLFDIDLLHHCKGTLCLWGKPLGNDFSTELTHKNTLLVTSPLQEVFVVLSIMFCKKNLRTHKFFSREPCSLYNDQQQYCTVSLNCFVLFKCFQANDSYLQMAIGNAPWPIGVTMVGIHARTGREKIFSQNVARILFL